MDSFVRTTETKKSGNGNVPTKSKTLHNNSYCFLDYCLCCHRHNTIFGAVLGVSLLGLFLYSNTSSLEFPNGSSSQQLVRKDKDGILRFPCPSQDYALNVTNTGGEDFDGIYTSVSKNITNNKAAFLSTFRTVEYDGWQLSYKKMKQEMQPFKAKYYPKYLNKEGATLYESACGIGLNLYMTLEIVAEERQRQHQQPISVTVYGNEYVPVSAEKARNVVLADGVIPEGNRQGTICAADSRNLTHVPSHAFDVVCSGYITPNMDLLGLLHDDDWTGYDDVCDAVDRYNRATAETSNNDDNEKKKKKQAKAHKHKNDWMANYLWGIMQERQQQWYGTWVAEMARIAKPGAPVIIESVSQPSCLFQNDWGGVLKDYWYEHAKKNTYHWDIDPNSIEIMDDTTHSSRYHVFMLKNK